MRFTAKEIRDKIQKIADEDHINSDCFLCVVMSHGNDENIMTSDNQQISFDEIVNRQDPDESTPSGTEDKPIRLQYDLICLSIM